MVLKQADLARRLGVDRSAISRALERGKLESLPDGTIDTENATNKRYLSRWTAHRGKTRSQPAPVSPNRAAAQLARARAEYGRKRSRFLRRKAEHLPADMFWQLTLGVFVAIQDALRGYADRVDLSSPTLERELESRMTAVLSAPRPKEPRATEPGPQPVPLPEDPGDNLDDVRSRLDLLAGAMHEFAGALEDGTIVSRQDAEKQFSDLSAVYFNAGLLRLPRRIVAGLSSVLATQGVKAAREYLRNLVAEEVARLDVPIAEIRQKVEVFA